MSVKKSLYRKPCRVTRQVLLIMLLSPSLPLLHETFRGVVRVPQKESQDEHPQELVVFLALQTVERVTTLSHVLRSDTDMKMM